MHLWVPYVGMEEKELRQLLGSLSSIGPAHLDVVPPRPTKQPGRLESDFNTMYNSGEVLQSAVLAPHTGKLEAQGLGPAEDLRLALLKAAMACDQGQDRLVYQTHDCNESLCIFIKKVVLLLPQSKFRPGDKVILLRTHKNSSSSSNGEANLPAPGSVGIVAEQQQQQSGKSKDTEGSALVSVLFDGSSTAVQVPKSQLLPVQLPGKNAPSVIQGDYVVVHGLQQQSQLSGSLARVQKMPRDDEAGSSGSSSNADQRCHVTLVPFLADTPTGGIAQQKQQSSSLRHIAPRMSCIAAVQQPECALLMAYASHNKRTPADTAAFLQFVLSQAPHISRVVPITTTPWEHGVLLRHIEQCKNMLGHCSSRLWAQLRGDLSTKHWTLGLFVPIKAPMMDDELHRRKLQKEKKCRQCEAISTKDRKLSACMGCKAVWYCSKECQFADWRARHKMECASKKQALDNNTVGSDTSCSRVENDSVWIAMAPPTSGPYEGRYIVSLGGHRMDMSKTPANKHGDREFIVKISNLGPESLRDVQIHDQAKTFLWYVEQGHTGHDRLMSILVRFGRTNSVIPEGRAAFLRAKRQGVYLQLFTDELPEQQQPW